MIVYYIFTLLLHVYYFKIVSCLIQSNQEYIHLTVVFRFKSPFILRLIIFQIMFISSLYYIIIIFIASSLKASSKINDAADLIFQSQRTICRNPASERWSQKWTGSIPTPKFRSPSSHVMQENVMQCHLMLPQMEKDIRRGLQLNSNWCRWKYLVSVQVG